MSTKVAIYVRVSTNDQDVAVQEKLCREYCERLGYDIFKVYADTGVSGVKDSRPAFNDLLRDMRLMRFNTIMVTKLDRIGRSLKHILNLFDEFFIDLTDIGSGSKEKADKVELIKQFEALVTGDQAATDNLNHLVQIRTNNQYVQGL